MYIDILENASFIAQASPSIAPCAPSNYSIISAPGKKYPLILSSSGTTDPNKVLYPGVLFCPGTNGSAQPRSILTNSGNVSFCFDLMVDSQTLTAANSIESDLIIVTNGMKYNLSGQRLVSTGEIQIGGWTNTTLMAGSFIPNTSYSIRWTYFYNTAALNCSVISYEYNNVILSVPTTLYNMEATSSNWESGAYIQFQMGSLPSGNPWTIKVSNVRLEWS